MQGAPEPVLGWLVSAADLKAAGWAALGGAMRAYVMHKEGARVTVLDAAATIVMAVGWGTALAEPAGPMVAHLLEKSLGWALPTGIDLKPASLIIVGLSATAITMGLVDFCVEMRRRIRGRQ